MSDTITPRLRIKAQPEFAVRAKAVPPPKVRLRVTPALLPMEIELRNTGMMVQWRYLGQDWQDLIAIDDLDTTVTVGSVTTLPPGSPATVANVGTVKDMVLNFGIPQGIQGIQGEAATIAVGTVTTVNAGVPAAVENIGTPNDAVFDFDIPQGSAATVAVGTVTTLAPGAPATVVNVGTSGAAVLNFGIPQGMPGNVTGPAGAVDNRVAVFDGTTGHLIKDSGALLGTVASRNTGTAAGNVPLLDGSGLLDTAVLPAIAVTDVFIVASQAAMLALTAQKGDIAIRSDLNKSFALATNSPSTLADWKELLTPTDAVLSVAGLTGAISAAALKTALALSNVDNTSDATKFAATAGRVAGIRGVAGTSDTFVAGDAGGFVYSNSTSPTTFTIPPNSSVAFPVGTTVINVGQGNTGELSIAPGAGVTLISVSSKRKLSNLYSAASIIKTGTDVWWLFGDLKA
ncbi:hypothetical protein [Devosia sp. Root105]|uniref:hypothetical protein n=1 Tax=Devosia sp. Root105 TaxID=1736423 RepID=UPI0006FDD597|nr:hypothetical protein [Devosia sp. Root105]KQV04830.1 hypothetical protein ASC68_27200 [Devosia sp. Root105]